MPTYEYQCKKCERVFELRQRISEPALTTHEGCGGEVTRLLSPAPFILKGAGWYVTDYPSEARKKAQDAEKTATKPSTNGSDTSSSGGTGGTGGTSTNASAPASSSPPSSD